jgi:hypothetical protein
MPYQMTIEVFGDKLVARKLLRFADRALDMTPAWNDVTDEFKKAFERNFAQQGSGWAQLKPSTIRSRIAAGYAPGPILTRSREYRTAMTVNLQSHKNPGELILLAPKVPGLYHQKGAPRNNMPARPLRLREGEKREVIKIIQRTLIEGYYQ